MSAAQVDQNAFNIATGTLFAIALLSASGRALIRIRHFKQFFIDDFFFILAVATLIGGTIMMFINFPLARVQVEVTAGVESPPADFVAVILRDVRTQYAASILLKITVVAVKFSFLFFFRMLLQRVTRWYVKWWWVVFGVCVPSSVVYILSNVISCPSTGIKALTYCVRPENLGTLNAVFRASVAIDIYTDILIITIPIALLWNVQIPLKKKLAFGAVLCLSGFMIVCSIVSISAANIVGGQVDSTWVLLWQELESCTAVTTASIASFRALFVERGRRASDEAEIYPHATRRDHFETHGAMSKRSRSDPYGSVDEEAGLEKGVADINGFRGV